MTSRLVVVRAASLDFDARTVDAVLATDKPVQVVDWDRYELIDEILVIDGAQHPAQVPMLDSHNRGRVSDMLGSIRNIRPEGGKLLCTLHFAETDEGSRALALVRDGHLTDISVGYRVDKHQMVPAGETKTIAGREFKASKDRSLRVATRWTVREGSPTPIGADPHSKLRDDSSGSKSKHRNQEHGVQKMHKQLRAYLESLGLRSDATDAEAWDYYDALDGVNRTAAEALRARYPSNRDTGRDAGAGNDNTPGDDDNASGDDADGQRSDGQGTQPAGGNGNNDGAVSGENVREEAARAERERIAVLQMQAREVERVTGSQLPSDLLQRAIDEVWDRQRANRVFLQALQDGRQNPVAPDAPFMQTSGERARHRTPQAVAMGLAMRLGTRPETFFRTTPGSAERADDRQSGSLAVRCARPDFAEHRQQDVERLYEQGMRYERHSLIDLVRELLQMRGRSVVGLSTDEVLRAAASIGEVTGLFTTNAGAVLIEAYEAAPDQTATWTRTRDVDNFKEYELHRLEAGAALKRHNRTGTAHHSERSSVKETGQIARYSRQWVIDEMDIIDNDLSPLLDFPREFGVAASQLRPDLVFAILLGNPAMRDGTTLFHANHANVKTSAALSNTTLGAAKTQLNTQSENGRPLATFAKTLLVPEALDWAARTEVNSAELRNTTGNTIYGTMNPAKDQFVVVADPRLDLGVVDPTDESVKAGSATTWYLAAQEGRHGIEVAYLAGRNRQPLVRSTMLTQGQWGMQFDVNMDIGAAAADWKGLQRNTA